MGSRKSSLKTDGSGQYYRQIGRKRGLTGQPKFRLGSDVAKAELAYHKLGLLWRAEVEQHERMQQAGADFETSIFEAPCWSEEALAIAEAIRKHLHVVRIGRPEQIEGDAAYATHLGLCDASGLPAAALWSSGADRAGGC